MGPRPTYFDFDVVPDLEPPAPAGVGLARDHHVRAVHALDRACAALLAGAPGLARDALTDAATAYACAELACRLVLLGAEVSDAR